MKMKTETQEKETTVSDRGPVWTGINEICEKFNKSPITVMNYKRDLDCPLLKDGGIWIGYENEIRIWAADLGVTNIQTIDHAKCFKILERRRRSGPGKVLRGQLKFISSSFQLDNCPFKKVPGTNEVEVDINRWLDFVEDQRLRE